MTSHPVVHVDIPARDRGQSAKFYGQVFGWQTQEFPEMGYTMFQAEGGPGGGFTQVGDQPQDAQPNRVVVYIGTDDIHGTLAQVEANGGTVMMPAGEIPGGMGWIAMFQDPAGNTIGLYSNPQ